MSQSSRDYESAKQQHVADSVRTNNPEWRAAMSEADAIDLLYATDDAYAPHLAVSWASLAATQVAAAPRLHLLDCGLTPPTRRALEGFAAARHLPLTCYPARLPPGNPSPATRFPPASWARLCAPDILPESLRRVLYLDADTLVRGDLRTLFHLPLGPLPLAAVPDDSPPALHQRPGLPLPTRSLNSGVLLMDLTRWRHEKLAEKLTRFLFDHGAILRYPDQDTLNQVLAERWLPLPRIYNYQVLYAFNHPPAAAPVIVHFVAEIKPWHRLHLAREGRRYRRLRRQTPWPRMPFQWGDARWFVSSTIGNVVPEATRARLKRLLGIGAARGSRVTPRI